MPKCMFKTPGKTPEDNRSFDFLSHMKAAAENESVMRKARAGMKRVQTVGTIHMNLQSAGNIAGVKQQIGTCLL